MRVTALVVACALALLVVAASGVEARPIEGALVEAQLVDQLDAALPDEPVNFAADVEMMELAAEAAPKTTSSKKTTAPKTTTPKTTAPKSTAPKGKSTPTPKTSSKNTPAKKEAPVKLTASTPDDVAKWAEHKARNRKKYATPEKEAAAFEKFKANRRQIEARNAKAAATSRLNKKPFSSKGALATKSPQQFKKFLRTKKPARGSGKTASSKKTSAPKSKARFVQLRRRVTQLRQSPGGAGKAVTKAGGVASKAGGAAAKAGGVSTKAGGAAAKSGGDAGKAGGVSSKSGGDAGKSGGTSSKSGGTSSKSGGDSTKTGGTTAKSGGDSTKTGGSSSQSGGLIVSPDMAKVLERFKPWTGVLHMNPQDGNDPMKRLCRVVFSVWVKRYADTPTRKLMTFGPEFLKGLIGSGYSTVLNNPLKFCTNYRNYMKNVKETQLVQKAFEALRAAPAGTPFLNRVVSLDVVPRDQELCGSCWAQVAVGTYEVALRKAGITSPPLSVQQVVDCAPAAGSNGCEGGTPMQGVAWLSRNFAATEAAYPYTGVEGQCAPAATGPQRAKGWEMAIPGCTEGLCTDQWKYEIDLMYKVQTTGPFIAYVDATNWQYYDKGIFPPSECTSHPDNGNHVVELLGYGQENGTPYWIIKNSWGAGWGENGYIRVAMGINSCGIANYVGHAVL